MVALRRWAMDDLRLLHETLGNPAMMEHLGGVESPEQIERRHVRYLNGGDMFTVWEGGSTVGSVGFWEREWRGEDVYEAGWMILPEFAGRGLATQAAVAVISLAREQRRHRFLHAFPSVENIASNAVCRNAGFMNLGECTFEYPKGHWMRCNDWRIDLFAHR
ncbi:MAG TPA: GNAT family N-acetyltransferase [Candidatus Baltobacteraceae bacterium]|nr:GNAT family N-acetyltransferase [Candidatus Baltobacteraceae bacterium]